MRVLFYSDITWSLGNIHNNLIKQFAIRGIYSNLLNWGIKYTRKEFDYLNKIYDVFVTLPGRGVNILISNGIDPKKIICVAHSRFDIWHGVDENIPWNLLRKVIAISPDLVKTHERLGVKVKVELVQNGIDFDLFYRTPAKKLTNIGYFGSEIAKDVTDNNIDIKRKKLAVAVSQIVNLPLILTGGKLVNICMPTLYETIDSLIMPSTMGEACGLPYMEAAAAGRLPISASCGIVDHLGKPAGIVVNIDDIGFIKDSVVHLQELKQDHKKYYKLCTYAQEFAREYYDWSKVIDPWIDLITGS